MCGVLEGPRRAQVPVGHRRPAYFGAALFIMLHCVLIVKFL